MRRSRGQPDEYYAAGVERERLLGGAGQFEFLRTQEIVERWLPRPPAVVADVGGGPGRYAVWLAEKGYRVHLRDLVPLHVKQARELAAATGVEIDASVGDALDLGLPAASADIVLLLGPLYHLTARRERVRALAEAARVVRPGGYVLAAAISRWAPLLDGVVVKRISVQYPAALELLDEVERSGIIPPLFPGSFAGFCHRPGGLRAEVRAAGGLDVVDLVGVEGLAFALPDLDARLATKSERNVLLDAARRTERVPELIGMSPHLLVTARRSRRSR